MAPSIRATRSPPQDSTSSPPQDSTSSPSKGSTSSLSQASTSSPSQVSTSSPLATPLASASTPPSGNDPSLFARLHQAVHALAADPQLSIRRAAVTHNVPRTTLSRRLASQGVTRVDRVEKRGRVLSAAEERQIICYIGQLEEMGVDLRARMLSQIAAKLVSRRDDPGLRNEKITDRWVAEFLRRWGLGAKFGRSELDDRQVDEDDDTEDVPVTAKEAGLGKLNELLEKEMDPQKVRRLAMRIAEFAAEAMEYQSALEDMVQRYNVALVKFQSKHIRRSHGTED